MEKRRGLGMFVREGARAALMESERQKFVEEEWPATLARVEQLGLDLEKLPRSGDQPIKKEDS